MITLALALCTETVQTFYFQGALNLQDEVLEGDKVYNAQFGAAIAAVGDLNQDGFQGKLSNLSLLEERQSSQATSCLISQARFSKPGTLKIRRSDNQFALLAAVCFLLNKFKSM